ncbi:MAG: helix-turn-helix domain-containing protein [Planctomycetales bacterium]|jgi:excisionase family DNA binding protein
MVTRELLTADELADRLKVRPGTVRFWSRQGRIPAIRLTPKVVRFDLDAVVSALVDERRCASGVSRA